MDNRLHYTNAGCPSKYKAKTKFPLVVNTSSNDVKQLVGDSLLPALVVL